MYTVDSAEDTEADVIGRDAHEGPLVFIGRRELLRHTYEARFFLGQQPPLLFQ